MATASTSLTRDPWRLSATGPFIVELESLGIGGLAPGITISGRDDLLVLDGWQRSALDTVDGHSRWQFLVPISGDYDLVVTDARTLIAELPAGGPESCYYVMVRRLPLPEPAAIPSPVDVFELESGVRLYTVNVTAGSIARVVGETPRISTLLGLTLLVNGHYVHSVTEEVERQARAARLDIDDSDDGNIVVAADASIDFAYAPVLARVLEQHRTAAGFAGGGGAR